jgi:maltooligosyltrehalose trehalohydrolase
MRSALLKDNAWHFKVWAPEIEEMVLHIVKPFEKVYSMAKDREGNFTVAVETKEKELQYFFRPNNEKDLPDPASEYQPGGVHGPSQTVDDCSYVWTDDEWKAPALKELIIYELHIGVFTPKGTFEAVIDRLDDLVSVGINAIEIMPVAQFPGDRNWGYDGVFPYAVQNSYGGPEGLKRLVDACHNKGIAVILDVVYNHLGPEGNYFSQFAPYFTSRYHTPWGDAINFDDAWSDGVREYFSENVIYWFENFHIDCLRCDAIHAMFDNGPVHFWQLTTAKVKALEEKLGKQFHLIAESDLNDPKVIRGVEQSGWGFDAQWLDDFHHALYILINEQDKQRYYDFGSISQMAKAYSDGFVHSGEWVRFRKRKYGASSAGIPGDRFVVFNQNHDQVGNREDGRRLNMLVDFERAKLAAAAILLSPYIPMLFMGEEYAEESPFFYFVSHSDKDLIKAVREGRKKEFAEFGFGDDVPDPQDENTYTESKLQWDRRNGNHHKTMLEWYKELIKLRKSLPSLKEFIKEMIHTEVIKESAIAIFRHTKEKYNGIVCLFNFSQEVVEYTSEVMEFGEKILDSREERWVHNRDTLTATSQVKNRNTVIMQPLSVVIYTLVSTGADIF